MKTEGATASLSRTTIANTLISEGLILEDKLLLARPNRISRAFDDYSLYLESKEDAPAALGGLVPLSGG